jgi:glycosidase
MKFGWDWNIVMPRKFSLLHNFRSIKKITIYSGIILFVIFLAGCKTTIIATESSTPAPTVTVQPTEIHAVPVQPISGKPQGTDGYAWWNDTIFYEIFVRSFYDSNADGIGDFNGIIEKLDYLNDGDPNTGNDLGITGIWLMPINPASSYHGYDTTDYYDVNPQFGTMEDFKRLLEECHKRGIRVIVDMVYNHSSNQHPWFVESRDNPQSEKRDWYVWSDTDLGYAGPWGEKVWYQTVSGYYYAIFWIGQPDLNYRTQAVTDEILDVSRFWLQTVGVDGFRLDAVRYLIEDGMEQQDTPATLDWWQNFYIYYKEINSQAYTVGEVYSSNYVVKEYINEKNFDQAFSFDLASQILKNVDRKNAINLNAGINSTFQQFPRGSYATFLSNHDQERVMSFFSGDNIKTKLAASVLFTTPGTPYIYYGEEIGMTGQKPDENIRTPMQWSAEKYAGFTSVLPWEPVNSNYPEFNVEIESNDPTSILNHYQKLIELRNGHAALRIGDFYSVRSEIFSILAYLRASQSETLMIIINLSDEPADGFTLTLTQGPLSGSYGLYSLWGDENAADLSTNSSGGFDLYKTGVQLPANSMVIYQLIGR